MAAAAAVIGWSSNLSTANGLLVPANTPVVVRVPAGATVYAAASAAANVSWSFTPDGAL